MQITTLKINDLVMYDNNPRLNDNAVDKVAESIRLFGFKVPMVVDKDHVIVCGHTRYKACLKLGVEEVPVVIADDLTDEQLKTFRLADNKTGELAEWDLEKLEKELEDLTAFDVDMSVFGFDENIFNEENETTEIVEDVAPEVEEDGTTMCEPGDLWQLGEHRLLCGDSTDAKTVSALMGGKLADLVFTDPPYGMKKESDGVLNDNLNYNDLLNFNKQWVPLTFEHLKTNGSWYCWGIDEPLMDIYSEILKPMIKDQKATFRNLITWDKGNGQGQLSENFRSYATADEKCLFVMCGVQGFNNNADNYFEGWEPIRDYLLQSRLAMGWDVSTMKKIVGHSDLNRDHWTNKSQFNFPTEAVYKAMQEGAEKQRREHGIDNDAFKQKYDDLKQKYYSTRAYFDNTHENMNNVWHDSRTSTAERELTGGHATPKPISLCARAIKSSSRESDIVLDVFGGSGSTLIACEQLKRTCYMLELDPRYCDVIIKRWEAITGNKAVLVGA